MWQRGVPTLLLLYILFSLLFCCFVVLLSCWLVVLLSCCLVVCLVYTFNKITKQQNNQTTNLQINLHTKHEGTALGDASTVDALIEDAVASAELWVDACVFGEGEDILCFSPYGESLEP